MIALKEISWNTYKDLNEMFNDGRSIIDKFRSKYKNDCVTAAYDLKDILMSNSILCGVIVFKNGKLMVDPPLKVFDNIYSHHAVVLIGDGIIDILHSDKIFKTKEYIETLEKDNSELRIDKLMSTGWFTDDGFPMIPTLEQMKTYKF